MSDEFNDNIINEEVSEDTKTKTKKPKKEKNTEPKEYSINDFEKDYNKYLGRDALITPDVSDIGIENIPRITTGSIVLDCDIGGGYPCWRISMLTGYESVGKTYLLNKAMASVTNNGGLVYFAEPEKTWDEFWGYQCGIQLKNVKMSDCLYAEQELDMLEMAIRSGVFRLVLLDSIAELITKKDLESENEKDSMARLAALLSKSFRKINSALSEAKRKGKEVYVIMTNQFRAKIGMFVGGVTEPGGNTVKYRPCVKIELRKEDNITQEDTSIIGQVVNYVIKKNKTFPPLKSGELRYFFDNDKIGDIDNFRGLFDLGVRFGFITKSGAWYSDGWLGDKKFQGADNAAKYLTDLETDKLNAYLDELGEVVLPGRKICFRF